MVGAAANVVPAKAEAVLLDFDAELPIADGILRKLQQEGKIKGDIFFFYTVIYGTVIASAMSRINDNYQFFAIGLHPWLGMYRKRNHA